MRLAYHPNRDLISTDGPAGELFAEVIKESFPDAQKILDLGAGRGNLVAALEKEGIFAVGIDLREIFEHKSKYVIADARRLPFRDESFDLLYQHYFLTDLRALQNCKESDILEIIKESYRVLKPKGYFWSFPAEYSSLFMENGFKKMKNLLNLGIIVFQK